MCAAAVAFKLPWAGAKQLLVITCFGFQIADVDLHPGLAARLTHRHVSPCASKHFNVPLRLSA